MVNKVGSVEWLRNQIREFEEEYENQSDHERCMFIDGKLTILKLWLNEKTIPEEKDKALTESYEAGHDTIINGANVNNCNIKFFQSDQMKNAWEDGRSDAKSTKEVGGQE